MKPYIKSVVGHPVLIATAAWLVLDGITIAVQVYQGVQNLHAWFEAALVAVASVVGAGVGTLVSHDMMRRRRSPGRRIISAVVSLVLATIGAFLVGAGVAGVMAPEQHNDLPTFIAACIAVFVGGPTGLVFGFTGGVFRMQIPTNSDSQPSTPSEGCTQDSLAGEHPANTVNQYMRVAAPVLIATAAWLVLYAIGEAARLYEVEEIRGKPFEALGLVVGSVAGAGVGLLGSRGVMRHRSSLGWRITSAGVSLGPLVFVLAANTACVVGAVWGSVEDAVTMALLAVAAPTSLVFGFTGGVFKKQIPVCSGSQP